MSTRSTVWPGSRHLVRIFQCSPFDLAQGDPESIEGSRGPTSISALGAPPPSAAARASRSRRLKAVARSRAATSRRARAAGAAVTVCLQICLFAFAFPSPADAQITAPCASYWNAGAVFVGRVEAIKRVGATRHVSFTVLEGFVGVTSSTMMVTTGPVAQRCGISFAIGKEYVVYADRPEGGALTTSRCSGTREVEDAAADLAYAREVKQGNAPVGLHQRNRICLCANAHR